MSKRSDYKEAIMAKKPKPLVKKEVPIKTELIVKSKKFKQYQRDFLKILLPNDFYTISEATTILNTYFKIETKEEK